MSEFHISPGAYEPDIGALEEAIGQIDPAVVLDFSPSTGLLRVAASVDRADLQAVLAAAGCELSPDAIIQLPSICCGGCSG